jgi:hypothetical protein
MRAWVIASAVLACALVTSAGAEEKATVGSLLAQGYQVVGTTATPAGAGLFLQGKDKLFFCLAAETQASPEVTTRYCKPVR